MNMHLGGKSSAQACRCYRDFLAAVYETFGYRAFTLQDLREKGIVFPAGKNPSFFRNRGLFERVAYGRPTAWRLSGPVGARLQVSRCLKN